MKSTRFNKRRAVNFFRDRLDFTVGPSDVHEMMDEHAGVVVVDVRREEDYLKGHIPGSINLPKSRWDTMQGLEQGKTHIVYCYTQQCHLAARACLKFAQEGYEVKEMEGGWKAWKQYGYEEESSETARRAA